MKWLIRLLIKPLIKPVKEAVRLCNTLLTQLDKLVAAINTLPLEQALKDDIIHSVELVTGAVSAVKDVLVKVLEYVGADVPAASNTDTVEKAIESVKKSLK